MSGSLGRAAAIAVLSLMLAGRAWGHVGPPFPIIENQRSGPYVISVWAHPDLGSGAFWVYLEPVPGTTLPAENEVRVSVQPLTGRLPEVTYSATRQEQPDKVQYYAEAGFDQQELWRVRVQVSSSVGSGEVTSQVEPTPTTYGRWDLLFYAFPFVLFGMLFLYRFLRRRKQQEGSFSDASQPHADEHASAKRR